MHFKHLTTSNKIRIYNIYLLYYKPIKLYFVKPMDHYGAEGILSIIKKKMNRCRFGNF